MLNDILKKHGVEEEGELGQSQFAELLQPIIQELADALAKKHVAVIHKIKIVNGSEIRKVGRYRYLISKLFSNVGISKHTCLLMLLHGKLMNILITRFLKLLDLI